MQDLRKLETYSTDETGYFQLKNGGAENPNRNILLDISYGSDRLFIQNNLNTYYYYPQNEIKDSIREQTLLFTDRSLYRPGQLVYFKGIVIEKNIKQHSNKIIAGSENMVYLFNSNEEVVDSISLKTNEFGRI